MLNEKVPFPVKKQFLVSLKKCIIAWPELSKLLLENFEQRVAKVCFYYFYDNFFFDLIDF